MLASAHDQVAKVFTHEKQHPLVGPCTVKCDESVPKVLYEKLNTRPWQILQLGNHVVHSSNLAPCRVESIGSAGKLHAPCGVASAEPLLKISPVRVSAVLYEHCKREMTAADELVFTEGDHESVRVVVSEGDFEGVLSVENRERFLSDLLICR